MKKKRIFVAETLLLIILLGFATNASAAIDSAGVLDNVISRYSAAASSWVAVITNAASWLFWTLVVISMVWTFGMMALRRADLGEFFAEFVRFTVCTGFFWWLLINGPNFADSIIRSLRMLAGNASGLGPTLTPSGIVDVGFGILDKVLKQASIWNVAVTTVGIIMAVVILVILALVGVNMLLLLIASWILVYAGIFFLGFGGSKWTSDMAIAYYRTVLSVAVQLFTMILIVGIGQGFLFDYYSSMSQGAQFIEMAVLLVAAVILLVLVSKVPSMIGQLAFGSAGGAAGGGGIGTLGAGAALGAASMVGTAAAMAGTALIGAATQAAGGGNAIIAALKQACGNVEAGTDIMSSFGGSGGGSSGSGGGSSNSSGSDLSFAEAAGLNTRGNDGVPFYTGSGSGEQRSSSSTEMGGGGGEGSKGMETQSSAGTTTRGFMPTLPRSGRIAVDAAANLVKGAGSVLKTKASAMIQDTPGGKIAAAIKQGNAKPEPYEPEKEIADFVNKVMPAGDNQKGGN